MTHKQDLERAAGNGHHDNGEYQPNQMFKPLPLFVRVAVLMPITIFVVNQLVILVKELIP
jgi:hypothetical protein